MSGQVVIVTGAGSGIGRAIAVGLARHGARLVVNDYGGGTDGSGGDRDRAERVANAIVTSGGSAVANSDAVGSCDAAARICDAALHAFGRIDVLVNNAGIMVAKAIDEISDAEFSRVIETNYRGSQRLIQAVWPSMKRQRHGRIINFSSNASLGFGMLSAYGSSKAALLGLTSDLAIEGRDHGILVNSILPVAATRLTNTAQDHADAISNGFTRWLAGNFSPDHILPIVQYLIRPDCIVSGKHFTAGGGRVATLSASVNDGYFNANLTEHDVAREIDAILDPATAKSVGRAEEEMLAFCRDIPMSSATRP